MHPSFFKRLHTSSLGLQVAYQCIDAAGVDRQPITNNNPWLGLYIILFVFLGAFFWVNLMVSVVIDHYLTLMGESSGN